MKIGKYRLVDLTTPRKWLAFLKSKAYHWGNPLDEKKELPNDLVAYCEQVVFRQGLCPACVVAGECLHCGCPSPDLFLDRDNFCSEQLWAKMLPTDKWEEFKIKNKLAIEISYG